MAMTNKSAARLTAVDSAATPPPVELRPMQPHDGEEVARILYDAFADIHDQHSFRRDFPTLESASQLTRDFIRHPSIWGVVAVSDGRVVGSNFVDERGPVTASARSRSTPRPRDAGSVGG